MFELMVVAAILFSAATKRWEVAIIFGAFYLCCRKADKYE